MHIGTHSAHVFTHLFIKSDVFLDARPQAGWKLGLQLIAGIDDEAAVRFTPVQFQPRVHARKRVLHSLSASKITPGGLAWQRWIRKIRKIGSPIRANPR